MNALDDKTLNELKVLRDLLEDRISELRRHEVDDDFFPLYTDKEIDELKQHEANAHKALKLVKKVIRKRLDDFIVEVGKES